MVSSSDDIDSGGRSGNLPAEKGHTASHSSAPPKYKERRVSVVRDYPPGYGRNAESVSRQSEISETLKGLHKVDVVASEEKMTCLVKDKPRKPYPPRRNVSATRDFPPFCGRNAAPLSEEETMRVATLQKNKNLNDEEYIEKDEGVLRNKIKETLCFARLVYKKLLHEQADGMDTHLVDILKAKGKLVNDQNSIGDVSGVLIGDEFQRHELNIVGLHSQPQSGIDCMKVGNTILATSIVAFGGYEEDLHCSDTLFYRAEGGNMMHGHKMAEDQNLDEVNLALTNSKTRRTAIRVIWAIERTLSDSRGKRYIYDGLYSVKGHKQEVGTDGKLLHTFQLVRRKGQTRQPPKLPKKNRKLRNGICIYDISQGREVTPISAYNKIDDDLPPQFHYVTQMLYPDWYAVVPPSKGCDCAYGCSDFRECSCVMKNAGMPYNEYGALLTMKPLVYECGPACKCPPSSYNRVSQHGIRYQLELFMTEKKGWGVRSLNSIPSRSFICEYLGELLNHEEADQRIESFDYLYDIGSASGSSQAEDEVGYTIDAALMGNVGRFINHSCSPNLVAQNVLYDHEDGRCPHIMFFATVDIPRMQELSFDYNYRIDEVLDAYDKIKKKPCYCGSSDCVGRMY